MVPQSVGVAVGSTPAVAGVSEGGVVGAVVAGVVTTTAGVSAGSESVESAAENGCSHAPSPTSTATTLTTPPMMVPLSDFGRTDINLTLQAPPCGRAVGNPQLSPVGPANPVQAPDVRCVRRRC